MSNYTGMTTGTYFDLFTYDPDRFNRMAMEGYSPKEILDTEEKPTVMGLHSTIFNFYMIYQYEVNGVTYYRASYKPLRSKNKKDYVHMKLGYSYEVHYNPLNPWESEIGKRAEELSKPDKNATNSFIISMVGTVLCVLVIPGIVLSIVSLPMGISALRNNTRRMGFALGAVIADVVTIPVSILLGLLYLALYNGFL